MNEPIRVSFFYCYIALPFIKVREKMRTKFIRFKVCFTQKWCGYWYCSHCKKLHSKRVIAFSNSEGDYAICSVGLEAEIEDSKSNKYPLSIDYYKPFINGKSYDMQEVIKRWNVQV